MANDRWCPPTVTLNAYARAQQNAGLPFNPSWLGSQTVRTPSCVDTNVAQPVDAGVAAAIRSASQGAKRPRLVSSSGSRAGSGRSSGSAPQHAQHSVNRIPVVTGS